MTLEDLVAQWEALLAARYRGVRTVEYDGKRITYASDAFAWTWVAAVSRTKSTHCWVRPNSVK
jgi:hypothetical protein